MSIWTLSHVLLAGISAALATVSTGWSRALWVALAVINFGSFIHFEFNGEDE